MSLIAEFKAYRAVLAEAAKKRTEHHLTESGPLPFSIRDDEKIATIVGSRKSGRLGTFHKESDGAFTVVIDSGDRFTVTTSARGWKISAGSVSVEDKDLDTAAYKTIKAVREKTHVVERPKQHNQDSFMITDGSGKSLGTHPTKAGAEKLAARYRQRGHFDMTSTELADLEKKGVWKTVKEGYFKMHPSDTHSYTVYKKDLNSGKLSHKEHLDNGTELENWVEKAYGKHVTILVRRDTDGKEITYTDNGQKFEVISKKGGPDKS